MTINVTEVSRGTIGVEVEMTTENHAASVLVTKSALFVLVRKGNSVNKIGKRFADVASAVAAYKSEAVRRMIETACEIAAA
jgi:hypothetical protein